MIIFSEATGGAAKHAADLARDALQISGPAEIATRVLDALAALPTLTTERRLAIQILIDRELASGRSGIAAWTDALLQLPLYAGYQGAGAEAVPALTAAEREALWLVAVDACKRVVAEQIVKLQAVVAAMPAAAPEGWGEV